MPIPLRPYPTVPMPRGPVVDPYQMLGVMDWVGGQISADRERQAVERNQMLVQRALQQSRGDFRTAGKLLVSEGKFELGRDILLRASELEKARNDALLSQMKAGAEFYKQGAAHLQGVLDTSDPTEGLRQWRGIEPTLNQFAEQYPPLRQMLPQDPTDFAQVQTSARNIHGIAQALAGSAKQRAEGWDTWLASPQNFDAMKSLAADFIATAKSGTEVRKDLAGFASMFPAKTPSINLLARIIGSPPEDPEAFQAWQQEMVTQLGKAAPDTPTPGTREDFISRYAREHHTTPDQLGTKDIETAIQRYARAQDRPGGGGPTPEEAPDRAVLIDALMRHPSAWKDLPAEMRGEVAPELARRGFDFSAHRLTPGEQREMERWYQTRLASLRESYLREYGETYRSEPAYQADVLELEAARDAILQAGEASPRRPVAASSPVTVVAPDGTSYLFDTQAQADEFKKAVGLK